MDVGNSLAVSFLLRLFLGPPTCFSEHCKMDFFFFPFSFSLTAIFLLCKETVFALTASLLKTEKENRSVFQRPVRRIRKHFAIHSVQRQSIMQWCYVARHISIPDISSSNPFWSSQLFLLLVERTQSWVVKQFWRAVLISEAAAVAFPPKIERKKQEIWRSRKAHLLFSNEAIKQKYIQSMKTPAEIDSLLSLALGFSGRQM